MTNLQKLRAASSLLLAAALAASISLVAQAPPSKPIKGVVVDKDGHPIPGVSLHGSTWKNCCPDQQDKATTDEEGKFSLEHAGAVIHFWKSDLLPTVYIAKPDESRITVVMRPDVNPRVLSSCAPADAANRNVGWGPAGLHFYVPKKGFKIQGGKPDVDYVHFAVTPKKSSAILELWFGPYAFSSEPEDETLVNSAEFSMRDLDTVHGKLGTDTRGRSVNGQYWRQTGVLGSGAIYKNAGKESAALFDKIIDSACWTPYSTN